MPTRIITSTVSRIVSRSKGWLTSPEPLYQKSIDWFTRRFEAIPYVTDTAVPVRLPGWVFSPEPIYGKTVEWRRRRNAADEPPVQVVSIVRWMPGVTTSVTPITIGGDIPWWRHVIDALRLPEEVPSLRLDGWLFSSEPLYARTVDWKRPLLAVENPPVDIWVRSNFAYLYSPEPLYGKTVEWARPLLPVPTPIEPPPLPRVLTAAIVVSPPPPPPPPAGPYFPLARLQDGSRFDIREPYVFVPRPNPGVLYGHQQPFPRPSLLFGRPFLPRVPNFETAHDLARLRRFTELVQTLVNSLFSQGSLVSTGVDTYAMHSGGYALARAPTVTDDSSVGVLPGVSWVNTATNDVYINAVNTVGAAVWVKVS